MLNLKTRFKNNKKIIILCFFIIFIITTIILIGIISTQPKTISKDSYTILKKESNISSINVKGTIESNEYTEVYSTVDSVIKNVNVKIGDYVKQGDLLAVIDSTSIVDSINQLQETIKTNESVNKSVLDNAKQVYDHAIELNNESNNADILQTKADIEAARLDFENKKYIFESYSALYEQGAISELEMQNYEIDFKNAKNTYDTALIKLDNLKKQLDLNLKNAENDYNTALSKYNDQSNRIDLDIQKEKLSQCNVTSPIDGIISSVNAAPGGSSLSNLFKIENINALKVIASVDEADISKIQIGQTAEIETDSSGNTIIHGEVTDISGISKKDDSLLDLKDDSNDKDVKYEVTINITDVDNTLKLGMNANVNIILNETPDAYTVPCESIFKDSSDNNCIYIAEKTDSDSVYKVKKINVHVGSESSLYSEIDGDDIRDDLIILTNPLDFEENSKIKIED